MTLSPFDLVKQGLSDNAALLMFRIQYWMPKAKVRKRGHTWIAKTRDEWADETGRTAKQLRTGFEELRRKGVIETAQMIFGDRPILHVRVLEIEDVKSEAGPQGQSSGSPTGHSDGCPQGPSKGCPPGQSLRVQQDTSIKTTRSLRIAAARGIPSGEIPVDGEQEEQKEKDETEDNIEISLVNRQEQQTPYGLGEIRMVSVAEMAKLAEATKQAKREKNKNLPVDASKDTPGNLHKVWRETMGELGEHVKALNGEQSGMFKALIATCPPGSAQVVLALAVREWSSFKIVLETDYGQWKVSEVPSLPVLAKHAEKAVTWWQKRLKAEKGSQKPVQALQATPAPKPPPAPAKAATPSPSSGAQAVEPKGEETWRFEFLVDEFGLSAAKEHWFAAGHKALPAKYAEVV